MEKQITKVQALEIVLAESTERTTELQEKLQAMLEQERKVATRKSVNRKPSKVAKEKAENMDKVKAFFEELTEPEMTFTLSEIGSAIGLEGATPQKLSAIVKPLVDSEVLTKDKKDKKVAYKLA